MRAWIFKSLFLVGLTAAILGSGAYFANLLFIQPEKDLLAEQLAPPTPPPPDPTLPEFRKCVELRERGDLLAARTALENFVDHFPQSTKLDEARDMLGEINARLLFSQEPSPEKSVYVVKSGDVISRVASRMKTTPELIMRVNKLSGTMLRIEQRLTIPSIEASLVIDPRREQVILMNKGRFFKQYRVLAVPPSLQKPAPARPGSRRSGHVTNKIAWGPSGKSAVFTDPDYPQAAHWIFFNIPGFTLYSLPEMASERNALKIPAGLGMGTADTAELAALLKKGDPVVIEP